MMRPHCDRCGNEIIDTHRTWAELPESKTAWFVDVSNGETKSDLCAKCYALIIKQHLMDTETELEIYESQAPLVKLWRVQYSDADRPDGSAIVVTEPDADDAKAIQVFQEQYDANPSHAGITSASVYPLKVKKGEMVIV